MPSSSRHSSRPRRSVDAEARLGLPAARRALELPELLLGIFSLATSQRDLSRWARVCRAWSDLALDRLWESLPSVVPLLELLSPLQIKDTRGRNPSKRWVFRRNLSKADWRRFRQYANRVRSLDLGVPISFTAISTISVYKTDGPLLPNLATLDWTVRDTSSCQNILPFLSCSLRNLSLAFDSSVSGSTISQLFRTMEDRTPAVTKLGLYTAIGVLDIDSSMSSWLLTLPRLEGISLHLYFQSRRIVNALGRLPSLASLTSNTWDDKYDGKDDDNGVEFQILEGTFPNLTKLGLDATIPWALQLCKSPQVSQLMDITLRCKTCDAAEDMEGFLMQLVAACPNLAGVGLILLSEDGYEAFELSFDNLRPLLDCNLERLQVENNYPIPLELASIEEMGRSWPSLRSLALAAHPDMNISSWTDDKYKHVKLLPTMAVAFPHLEVLSLFLGSSYGYSFEEGLGQKHQFLRLETLDLGFSPPPREPQPLAFLLGSIINESTVLMSGPCQWNVEEQRDIRWEQKGNSWYEIGKWAKMASRFRRALQKDEAEHHGA